MNYLADLEQIVYLKNGLIFYAYGSVATQTILCCRAATVEEARLKCAEMILQNKDTSRMSFQVIKKEGDRIYVTEDVT